MNLNGKTMVAVAMMVSSMAAIGCNNASAQPAQDDNGVAPQETAATAPVVDGNAANASVEKDARFFRYYAPVAPPVARVEFRGVAPSARHFWAPGYYRWTGREHVWVGGRWEMRRPGLEYLAPHWVPRFGRYQYMPGRWVRR
jgi:hypothetical protein